MRWLSLLLHLILPCSPLLLLSACATTSAPGPHEQLQFQRLQKFTCSSDVNNIFRLTVLRDDALLGAFDLEQVERSDGNWAVILRDESMDELIAWEFTQAMAPRGVLQAEFGPYRIAGYGDRIEVDGRSFRLGPSEFACLVAGRIPGTWLNNSGVQWDRVARRFVRKEASRTIRFNSLPEDSLGDSVGDPMEIEITWPSSWFSSDRIRVLVSPKASVKSSGGTLFAPIRGSLVGPHGVFIKWVEV